MQQPVADQTLIVSTIRHTGNGARTVQEHAWAGWRITARTLAALLLVLAAAPGSAAQEWALSFDGVNDLARNFSMPGQVTHTYEMWIRLPDDTTGGGHPNVIGQSNGITCAHGSQFFRSPNSGFAYLLDEPACGNSSQWLVGNYGSCWLHVAGSFDGTTMRLYANGVPIGSRVITVAFPLPTGFAMGGTLDAASIEFGRCEFAEVRFWNYARSDADIAQNLAPGSITGSEPGLVALYRLDEGAGDIAIDASPNGYHLQLGNTSGPDSADPVWIQVDLDPPAQVPSDALPNLVTWWEAEGGTQDSVGANHGVAVGGVSFADGENGQAFSFDGSTGYIDLVPDASMDFGSGDFSISVWLNLNTLGKGTSDGARTLVHKVTGTPLVDAKSYFLEYMTTGHPTQPEGLRFAIGQDGLLQNDLILPASLTAGQWHHVAGVRQGNANHLYLDGKLLGSQTAGASVDTGTGGVARIGNIAPHGVVTSRYLDGQLDEIALYDRALTACDAAALAGTPPVFASLGFALAGSHGKPSLSVDAALLADTPMTVLLQQALENSTTTLVIGFSRMDAPFKGGTLVPTLDVLIPLRSNGLGEVKFTVRWPTGAPSNQSLYLQFWINDPMGVDGFAASNALSATTP